MGIQAKNPNEEDEPVAETAAAGSFDPVALTAVDHLAIVVEDLDEAIAEHRENFGVLVDHREEWHEDDAELAFLPVGATSILLIAPTDDGSEYAEFLAEGGPGLHHIAYRVADLDTALDALRAAGRELVDEEPRPGPRGSRVAFVHPDATSGVLVQLVER